MLRGHFTDGNPFVDALVSITGFSIGHGVEFLVDTGAEVTCLMPGDWSQWGIDYAQLDGKVRPILGIGGFIDAKLHRATFLFTEDNGVLHFYGQDILIVSEQPAVHNLPSTLGQDVLSYWRLIHDPSRGEVSADVHWAGWTFDPADPSR